jgi:hypothetical protein
VVAPYLFSLSNRLSLRAGDGRFQKKKTQLVLVIDLTKNVSHVMLVLLFASSLCSLAVKDLLEHMHVGGTRRPTP